MPKLSLTPENIKFIKANRLKMSGSDMARVIGVNKDVVGRYMRKNGLTPDKKIILKFRSNGMHKPFTREEDDFIKKTIAQLSTKEIGKKLHRTGGYISRRAKELGFGELLEQKRKDSLIKKGNIPANKGKKMSPELRKKVSHTWFKKGHQPKNTAKKNGEVRIRHELHNDTRNPIPYKYIRIAPGNWKLLHQHLWEQKHGEYNKRTHCIWYKDHNTMNCDLDNLELITRAENLRRNRAEFLSMPQDLKEVKHLNNKLNKLIHENRRKRNSAGAE